MSKTPAPTEMAQKTVQRRVKVNVPYERFLDCVHCGLCINYCPTYVETGIEADSPRGRIHLLRSLADGKLEFGSAVKSHLDLCLGCLACESACPSGVHYREIIEAGRELSRQHSAISPRRWAMERTLYNPDALDAALQPLRLAGRFGLERAARAVARRLPAGLGEMVALLPRLPPASLRRGIPSVIPAIGEKRASVGFLTGCVMSVLFTPTNLNTLKVLSANGCEIRVPAGQRCCGSLAIHAGDLEGGLAIARKLIDLFEPLNLSTIIVNSAGCGSVMKDYGHLFAADPVYAERAERFASSIKDVSEYLAGLPLKLPPDAGDRIRQFHPGQSGPLRVTYHDACHLAHGQKVRQQPRALIQQIPGVELVELRDADWCCGSAGAYNLTQPEMAGKLLQRKVNYILETGAEIVISGNPGCSLQMARGLREAGSSIRVMHTMDFLAAAYPDPEPGSRRARKQRSRT
ncbi:MAG TPA: (Fe-S)-binding protein [Armatimonadota bacterium]|nr:(Fe-S)-binding protein [Armatimonadota bacterium]